MSYSPAVCQALPYTAPYITSFPIAYDSFGITRSLFGFYSKVLLITWDHNVIWPVLSSKTKAFPDSSLEAKAVIHGLTSETRMSAFQFFG